MDDPAATLRNSFSGEAKENENLLAGEQTQPSNDEHEDKSKAVSECPTSASSEDVESMGGEVLGAAGVVAGGSLSHVATEQGAAGVVAGGSDCFMLLLAHTHYPWLDDFNAWMTGHKLRDGGIALYDCTGLSQIVLPPTHDDMDRTSQLIDLFFQYRYYKALKKPAHDFAVRSSPNALAEAWTWFVRALLVDQDEWFGQLKAMKQDYHEHGIEAMKMEIHQQSIKENVPCCVRRCQKCPMCYKDSQKSGDATREGHKGVISDTLRSMIFHFDKRWIKYDADAEEEEARDRAIQEDIIDDTCFAQIDQGWIQQQIRNVESETYGIKSQNNVLQRGIKSLIRSDTRQRIMIKDLQDDLDDLKQLIKDAGIERRARKS